MNFKEAIDLLVEDGRVRGLLPSTLEHHRMFTERFAEWCGFLGIVDVRDVTLKHVLDFRRSVDCRKRYSTLRRRSAKADGQLSVNYRNLHDHDKRKLPRGIMDKDQVTKLLQTVYIATPTGFRDRTIF
ncbi:MAG: hypothetical protein NTU83_03015 [Candidatus Hydrogenedentes bacterium]|nr:hypothetical protein [Candidatus Hydrogenedentota bacterium]